MEPLIDPSPNLEPAQIPHHKSRKRIHLEVKESLKKVSTEVRQKIVGAVSVLSSSLQRRDSDVKETPGQVKQILFRPLIPFQPVAHSNRNSFLNQFHCSFSKLPRFRSLLLRPRTRLWPKRNLWPFLVGP